MGSLVYAFIHSATSGWGDPVTLVSFGAAAVLLAAFLAIESRSQQPLMPIHLFGQRTRRGRCCVTLFPLRK